MRDALLQFLIDLATDTDKLADFYRNRDGVMEDAGLDEGDKALLSEGSMEQLYHRLEGKLPGGMMVFPPPTYPNPTYVPSTPSYPPYPPAAYPSLPCCPPPCCPPPAPPCHGSSGPPVYPPPVYPPPVYPPPVYPPPVYPPPVYPPPVYGAYWPSSRRPADRDEE